MTFPLIDLISVLLAGLTLYLYGPKFFVPNSISSFLILFFIIPIIFPYLLSGNINFRGPSHLLNFIVLQSFRQVSLDLIKDVFCSRFLRGLNLFFLFCTHDNFPISHIQSRKFPKEMIREYPKYLTYIYIPVSIPIPYLI